jgi:hypothetical protein
MVSLNNAKRHQIKKMRRVTFFTFKNRDKKDPSCSVCDKPINIGDEYFYNKYKHYKYNHLYCADCAIEKNLLIR